MAPANRSRPTRVILQDPIVFRAMEVQLSLIADDHAAVLRKINTFEHLFIGVIVFIAVLDQFPAFTIKMGIDVSVVPMKLEAILCRVFTLGEVPRDDGINRRRQFGRTVLLRRHADGRTRIHCPIPHVHDVTRHIAEGSGAIIPPAAPCKWSNQGL